MRRLLHFGACDGVATVERGVRKQGFKGGGAVELPVSSFCKVAACLKIGVTLKGLRAAENNVAVEESCVLGNSGTALFLNLIVL